MIELSKKNRSELRSLLQGFKRGNPKRGEIAIRIGKTLGLSMTGTTKPSINDWNKVIDALDQVEPNWRGYAAPKVRRFWTEERCS